MATHDIKTITLPNADVCNLVDAGAQRTLVSGTNIKTVEGSSVLGSGDLELVDSSVTTLFTALGWTAPS